MDRKGCLPVCTINFINYKHKTQARTHDKTVYNNYIAEKLGNTEPAYLDQHQQAACPNCTNSQNKSHSPNFTGIQFHPGSNVRRLPEVVILERSQRDENNSEIEENHQSSQVDDRKGEEDLPSQSGASLMLAQSKRLWQSRRKSMNIRLNRMTDNENEVSPWSKTKAVEEQESNFRIDNKYLWH